MPDRVRITDVAPRDGLQNEPGFVPTGLYQNGTAGVVGAGQYNSIAPHFYGPDGEEIGATFAITSGWPGSADSTSIVGVTVAKRD